MNQHMTWKEINHPQILPGYLISPYGDIKAKGMKDSESTKASYHSTNGYDYVLLYNKSDKLQLFPIDDIVAYAYLPIPESLKNKPIKVLHVDGNTRNNELGNLEWVEDVEEWRDISFDFIKSEGYKLSSWGRVKNPKGEQISNTSFVEYPYLTLRQLNNNRKRYHVHRLEAVLFGIINDYFDKMDINHIDGNKCNNYWKNLEGISRGANLKHAYIVGLRNSLNEAERKIIRDVLIKLKGGVKASFKYIKSKALLPDEMINENIVQNTKNKMIDEGIKFDIMLRRKINDEAYRLISKLIIKYDGNHQRVLKEISNKYPEITIDNIDSVRYKLQKKGFTFTNYKHNRKITESERHKLLKLLDENNLSPSKTFNNIKNIPEFSNVTVYDLKYLKRKYRA